MTNEHLENTIKKIIEELGLNWWTDDVAAMVQLVPADILEISAVQGELIDNPDGKWNPHWVKACIL